jgi:hypothetical protein
MLDVNNGNAVIGSGTTGTVTAGVVTIANVPADRPVKLRVNLPPDHKFTTRNATGTNEGNDSDVHASGNKKATTDPFSLTAGGSSTITNQDCGLWAPGSIEVQVWNDKNGNGKRDDSNSALNGIFVEMLDVNNNNNVIGSGTTAAGLVSITGVPADRPVKLRVTLPPDHKFTTRNATGTNEGNDSDVHASGNKKATTDPFSLTAGGSSTITNQDCGMWAPGSVEVQVWNDKNGNGKRDDSNSALDGILVEMLDVNNGNGVIGSANTSGGVATIAGVPADRPVKLRVNLPADHKFTTRNAAGTNEGNDSDVHASGNKKATTDPFSLTAGGSSTITDQDCGLWTPGKLEAQVWMDKNGNGKRDDSGDNVNVYGMRVNLLETNGSPVLKNNNPVFAITECGTGLAKIDYVPADRPVKLEFELFTNGVFTTRNAPGTNEGNDSDVHASGNKKATTDPFSLTAGGGTTITNQDAGLSARGDWTDATIESFVWDDIDADKNQNGEYGKGIANVKVRLTDNSGNTCVCEKTDANGIATLPAIAGFPTQYRLKFDLPTDYRFTPQNGGLTVTNNSDANANTGQTGKFSISAGQTITYIDAGMWAPGTLETFVWDDIDADKNQNGEYSNGINDVLVELLNANSTPVTYPSGPKAGQAVKATTTTRTSDNKDGYAFLDYVPADRELRLKYTLLTEHRFTPQNGGVTVANNSDANASSGITGKFQVAKGSHKITYVDAGMWRPGTLETFVWDDIDADKNQNGEYSRGINGVKVELLYADQTAVTYPSGPNVGQPVMAMTATRASDNKDGYAFLDYLPADQQLRLRYTLPTEDYRFTPQNGSITVANNSDANASTGVTGKFQVAKGSHKITYVDAGMWTPGQLETFVWDDIDADKNQNGEYGLGIAGVDVELLNADNTPVYYPTDHPQAGMKVPTATTDSDGKATIAYIPASRELRLKYTLLPDHKYTSNNGSITVANNSDVLTLSGITGKFKAVKGDETITYVDAGMWTPGQLETFVWDDIDADANQNGEYGLGIAGVDVELLNADNTPVYYPTGHTLAGQKVPTETTDSDGKATFDYIPANRELRLQYTLLPDHRFTPKNGTPMVTNNSDANLPGGITGKFQVEKGDETITYIDAGMWTPGSVETFVWEDIDGDKNQNGEYGLGVNGVLVKLLNADFTPVIYPAGHPNSGNPVNTLTANHPTTGNPGYAMLDYLPADRQVRLEYVIDQCNATFTPQNGGIAVGNNSDANTSTGRTGKFAATKGSHKITYVDAGLATVGDCDPVAQDGYLKGAGKKGQARWRNFRTNNSGWDVAVGTDVGGNSATFTDTDFGNVWNFLPGVNDITLTYDPGMGILEATTTNSGGLYTTTHTIGDVGTVNYLQWFIRGNGIDPFAQTVSFNNVQLVEGINTYDLGNFSVTESGANYYLVLDMTSGFTLSGQLTFDVESECQECGKLDVIFGTDNSGGSRVAKVDALDAIDDIVLYPVPASDFLNVEIVAGVELMSQYQIVDLAGKVILRNQLKLKAGSTTLKVPVSDLAAGHYVFHVLTAEGMIHKKFVILR